MSPIQHHTSASNPQGRLVRGVASPGAWPLTSTLLAIPIAWLLGLSFLWVYAVAGAIWLLHAREVAAFTRPLLALGTALAFAVILSAFGSGIDDRTIAAVYNITILLCACAFYYAGRSTALDGSLSGSEMLRRVAILLFAIYTLYYISMHQYGVRTREIVAFEPSLVLGQLPELPGILRYYARLSLYQTDWTSFGPVIRPFGFGIYTTEGAIIYAMTAVICKYLHADRPRILLLIDIVSISIILVSGSRGVLVGYTISVLLFWSWTLFRRGAIVALISLALSIVLVGLLLLFGTDAIENARSELLAYRAGSSNLRILSYTIAIQRTAAESPLFGLGVKPYDAVLLGIPVGSHSAFVSIFTKSGLIGLSCFAWFYFRTCYVAVRFYFTEALSHQLRAARLRAALALQGSITAAVWMIVEDIDAAAMGTALVFLTIGMGAGAVNALHRDLSNITTRRS